MRITKKIKPCLLKVHFFVILEENRNTIGWWIYRFFFWGGFSLLSYNVYLVFNHNKKTKVED